MRNAARLSGASFPLHLPAIGCGHPGRVHVRAEHHLTAKDHVVLDLDAVVLDEVDPFIVHIDSLYSVRSLIWCNYLVYI